MNRIVLLLIANICINVSSEDCNSKVLELLSGINSNDSTGTEATNTIFKNNSVSNCINNSTEGHNTNCTNNGDSVHDLNSFRKTYLLLKRYYEIEIQKLQIENELLRLHSSPIHTTHCHCNCNGKEAKSLEDSVLLNRLHEKLTNITDYMRSAQSKCTDNSTTPMPMLVTSTTPIPGSEIISDGSSLRLVSRSEWLAQPPNSDLDNFELPAQSIIIAHTATENCSSQASCAFRVRYIQIFHMESQGWDDIAYNFLVGGDGSAYEGRGWKKEGCHAKEFNNRSICIAFIGTFNNLTPPERQLIAAQKLIEQGVKSNKLISNYQLYGHRQIIPTQSPGLALYNIIKKWPRWSDFNQNLLK